MKKKIDPYLVGILLIAAFFNFYGIWNDETVNPYYTAAVTSMVQNFHNFFYAAFDPAGFITVDKPPVAFWFQALSAKIFGVHGWSVILPQALAGIGSVFLLYLLIKPRFGKWAARIASLVLAITPIAVAVNRTNNVDAILVFFLLLGTFFLFKAVNRGKFGWLLLAFIMIGIGFNVKMLQAYMVLPAFILFYLIGTKISWKKKTLQLGIALVLMLGVSVSWAMVVDSTNADSRPYIGSSQTNSVLELAFGYNGVERLLGQETGMGTNGTDGPQGSSSSGGEGMQAPPSGGQSDGNPSGGTPPSGAPDGNGQSGTGGQPPSGGQQGDPPSNANGAPSSSGNNNNGAPGGNNGSKMQQNSGGMFGTGEKGPLRLFQTALGDQISWFLPLALFGMLGIFFNYRYKKKRWFHLSETQKEMVFWAAWLIPVAGFFSVAGFFHHYYLIMLAPAIAALSGAGFIALLQLFRQESGWKTALLPASITATGVLQAFYVSQYSFVFGITLGVLAIIGSGLLLFSRMKSQKLTTGLATVSLILLLAAPTYWSLTPLIYGSNSSLPETGPQLATSSGGGFADATVDTNLISYLEKNTTRETYLFGTTDSTTAGPYIIKTKKAVLALGGFNGTDPTLTVKELKQMIKDGELKYFYLPSNSKAADSSVIKWIEKNGTEVDASEYGGDTDATSSASKTRTSGQSGGMPGTNGTGNGTLYLLK
ncbi:glycosyltransferase family 39 protein [Listeria valentina]|uniref:glycosyltransferase family 39 protein n=1 Tax=Listeria valentina TaxID=2705293 RepID=UPI00143082FC|nr:glycosyltransferase family 39 protein [Listeria valentina]